MNDHNLKKEIIAEILKTYQELPDEFYAHALFQDVQYEFYLIDKYLYQDTVMRYFRQLREDGVIKCECISRQKSLYLKG